MKQEKPIVKMMRENFVYFGGISLLYGVIFAFCLYKNTHGVTFPLYVIATIVAAVLFMKKINYKVVGKTPVYLVGMVLLGISTAMTTSSVLHLFNWIGILLLFMVFMIQQFYMDKGWNFPQYLKRILILLGTTVVNLVLPFQHGVKMLSEGESRKKKTVLAVLLGLGIAILLLAIVLPLLLSSDMMFAKLFGQILKYLNVPTVIGAGVVGLIGIMTCYGLFAALGEYNFPAPQEKKLKTFNPIIGITFTAVLAVIYFVYSFIQIIYVFAGMQKGLPEGVTYALYAHTGFYQLLAVGIINFILVMVCMYVFDQNLALRILLTTISGCTFIMMISAMYRMLLYVGEYHLTFLRVLVLWFLVVLVMIMTGVIVSMYRTAFPLFKFIVGVVACMYIGLSLSRPDAWIAAYDIRMTKQMNVEDVSYMMNRLSLDATVELAKVDPAQVWDDYTEEMNPNIGYRMHDYFSDIVERNQGIYFRKANYSRIRATIAAKEWLQENAQYDEEEYGW
ncbi:MAG: DUF4173 domain-containing protein [Hespellia sp.]|nr:DUF4173 domain-containing protein [Hespellia sp.]